jgi:ligand-binding sensor domain-containing protein
MPVHHVTTLFEDHLGRMWFGLEGGLYVYDKDVFRPILHTDGTPLGIVFSITEDTRQRIWVRAGSNLDRIDDFTLREERTSPQISTAYILAATPDGGVILGLVDGELLKYKDGKEQSIPSNGIGSRTQIRDLLVEPDGTIWGTTLNELFSIRGSTRKNLNRSNGLPCDGIFALVEDDAKAIWLYSQCGLIRISRSELNQWGQHPETVLHPQLIDEGDGVQPGLTSLKPQASRAPDGRLWFVNGRTLQTIDADHLKVNLTPPVVHIEAARADLREYSPVEGLHLPALTRDLEIDYTAISFVAPQKVRFRSLNYRSRASVSVYQPRPSFHAPVLSKSASLRRFPMLLSVNL